MFPRSEPPGAPATEMPHRTPDLPPAAPAAPETRQPAVPTHHLPQPDSTPGGQPGAPYPLPGGPHTGSYPPVWPAQPADATRQLDFRTPGLPQHPTPPPDFGYRPNTGAYPPVTGTPHPEQPWHLGAYPNPAAPQPYSTGQHPAWPGHQPPAGGRTRLYVGIAAVIAVVAAGITVAVIATGQHSGTAAGSSSPTMISALTSDTPAPGGSAQPGPATGSAPGPAAAAVIPGYQVVSVPARGAAYDVPKDWVVDAVGTAIWGDPPDSMEIAGLTQEGKDYCPNYVRTNAFLTVSSQSDPARAAADVGTRMAKIGWSTATGSTAGAAESLTSLDGQLHGSFVEITGSAPAPAPGCASTFAVYTFAFPNENGSFVMTVAADTGVPKSIDKDTAKKILASIRPLQGH